MKDQIARTGILFISVGPNLINTGAGTKPIPAIFIFLFNAKAIPNFQSPYESMIGGDCIDSDSTMEGVTVTATRDGKLLAFWAGPAGLYMDESTDGGMHWGTDRVIAPDRRLESGGTWLYANQRPTLCRL
ncbi:MAG: hypothetical protein HWD58_03350 [Bacteroidota bacterium]|nr:MAG: hypothetical protein HWD58_03350 [Bacteroidota bacterium]